mgnify:CR=1 FL=1
MVIWKRPEVGGLPVMNCSECGEEIKANQWTTPDATRTPMTFKHARPFCKKGEKYVPEDVGIGESGVQGTFKFAEKTPVSSIARGDEAAIEIASGRVSEV